MNPFVGVRNDVSLAVRSILQVKRAYVTQMKCHEALTRKNQSTQQRIEQLESRNRELELIAPALNALSDLTHDPELVLNNFVPKEQIQIKDGQPVIIDGYEQLPVAEYVKNKLEKEKPYLLKNRSISGGGAPITKPTSNGQFSEEMLKPFLRETENQTEQHRIASVYGVETWQKLRNIAESR